jgi:hypothetical protein
MVFGILALAHSLLLLAVASYYANFNEIFVNIGQLLWLGGNFLWMWGELVEINFPELPDPYDMRREQGMVVSATVALFRLC